MSNRAEKLVKLRIFDNPATGKPWDSNVLECGYGCLLVSQVGNHSSTSSFMCSNYHARET